MPPSARGTISPNRPASRRSAKSSTGKEPSRSCSAARAANRGANRRAASSACTVISSPPRRSIPPPRPGLSFADPPALVEHGGGAGRHDARRAAGGTAPAVRLARARRSSQASMPPTCGRMPRSRRSTPCRAHSATSARASTNNRGSWMPRGTVGSRSAIRTATSRASAVSFRVSSTSTTTGAQQPTRLGHRARPGRHVLQQLTRGDHVGAAVGQRDRCGITLDHPHPVLGRLDAAPSGSDPPRRGGSPCRPGAARAGRRRNPDRQATRPDGWPAAPARRGPQPASAASRTRHPAATTHRPDRRTGADRFAAAPSDRWTPRPQPRLAWNRAWHDCSVTTRLPLCRRGC